MKTIDSSEPIQINPIFQRFKRSIQVPCLPVREKHLSTIQFDSHPTSRSSSPSPNQVFQKKGYNSTSATGIAVTPYQVTQGINSIINTSQINNENSYLPSRSQNTTNQELCQPPSQSHSNNSISKPINSPLQVNQNSQNFPQQTNFSNINTMFSIRNNVVNHQKTNSFTQKETGYSHNPEFHDVYNEAKPLSSIQNEENYKKSQQNLYTIRPIQSSQQSSIIQENRRSFTNTFNSNALLSTAQLHSLRDTDRNYNNAFDISQNFQSSQHQNEWVNQQTQRPEIVKSTSLVQLCPNKKFTQFEPSRETLEIENQKLKEKIQVLEKRLEIMEKNPQEVQTHFIVENVAKINEQEKEIVILKELLTQRQRENDDLQVKIRVVEGHNYAYPSSSSISVSSGTSASSCTDRYIEQSNFSQFNPNVHPSQHHLKAVEDENKNLMNQVQKQKETIEKLEKDYAANCRSIEINLEIIQKKDLEIADLQNQIRSLTEQNQRGEEMNSAFTFNTDHSCKGMSISSPKHIETAIAFPNQDKERNQNDSYEPNHRDSHGYKISLLMTEQISRLRHLIKDREKEIENLKTQNSQTNWRSTNPHQQSFTSSTQQNFGQSESSRFETDHKPNNVQANYGHLHLQLQPTSSTSNSRKMYVYHSRQNSDLRGQERNAQSPLILQKSDNINLNNKERRQ